MRPRELQRFAEVKLDAGDAQAALNLLGRCPGNWLLVQADSLNKQPIEVSLKFSGGEGGPGLDLVFSVARSSVVCVPAAQCLGTVRNIGNASTTAQLRVHFSDLPVATQNVLTLHDEGNGALQDVPIAAQARTVRLDVSDPAQRGNSFLELTSPGGLRDLYLSALDMPPEGCAVGGSQSCAVLVPSGTAYRVTFWLQV